jgi:signal transduction histidine kinase
MRRLFLILVLQAVQALPVFGQQKIIDSLSLVLNKTKDPQQHVDILNQLSLSCFDHDTEKGYDYAMQAFEEAKSLNYFRGKRLATTLKGFYFFYKGDFTKALTFYRQYNSLPLPEDDLFGYNLVMTGNVFRSLAQYDSALVYYNRAISLLQKLDAQSYLAFGYKNLARLYVLQWKNRQAEDVFLKALEIYQKAKNKRAIADTWFSLSDVSKNNANFAEAQSYIEKGCQLAHETGDEYQNLNCLVNQGDIHYRQGDNTSALKNYFEALELLKSNDMPTMLVTAYTNIGDVYEAMAQYDVSLKYYLEALRIAERINLRHEIGRIYSSMAWTYKSQYNFKLAHEYLEKSLDVRKQIQDEHGISNSYNVLGVIFLQEKKYTLAMEAIQRSLEIRQQIGHREGVSVCLFNLALVLEEQQQYGKALQYQIDALSMDEVIGNKFNIGISYNSLGRLYTKLKKFAAAENFLTLAKKMADETASKSLMMNNHLYWSEYFEARKNPDKALMHHKQYASLNDSIYSDIGAHKLAELEALYQMEKKDASIELLNQEKLLQKNEIKLQRSQIRLQNIFIVSGIAGFTLLSLLTFLVYKYSGRIKKAHREISEQKEEIQSQAEELTEANHTIAEINKRLEGKIEERTQALSQAYKELDTFFYRSSHDFRRPLTTFLGLAEVAKITVKDPNALELFSKVKETAINLDKMLIKLQSISDLGSQQLVYKEVMIKQIFDSVCDTFRESLQHKHIRTSAEISLTKPFISYPALIKIIIENLVENSIHFSGVVNSYIRLRASNQNPGYLTLDIEDNGQGIGKEYLGQVFDMYFRANEHSKGNGLGLYIVKKAVEKLDGSISVSSIPLVGSTFTMMFPMGFPS